MRTIRTTLLLSLPFGACVLNQPESTTDIALDTGSETTQISAGDDSSSSGVQGSSSSSDADSSSGAPDPDSSSSGAPDLCGNGILDPGEDCDGDDGGKTCNDYAPEYNGGQLGCTDCKVDTGPCERCEAPTEIRPCDESNDDPFNAIELDCDLNRGWLREESVPLLSRTLPDGDPTAYRVWGTYGNSKPWTPRAGKRALIVSTGTLAPVTPDGALNMGPGHMNPGVDNKNPNYPSGLPTLDYQLTPTSGGTAPFEHCDGEGDCSNTLANQWEVDQKVADAFYLEFQTVVPPGTHGYELDVAFFTAHYPVYNNVTEYNDVALIWSQSELYVGTITYLNNGNNQYAPMSLTALVAADLITYDGGVSPELLGTGFHGKDTPGGATPWLTAAGPAKPGESLTLAITIFDLNDGFYDSAMLVDNFRWSCAGCDLEVDCGLRLQQ